KLDKATSLGVALMTEHEMVAKLTAGGAGKDKLAGASEKLAEKVAEDAASATEVSKVVAELRTFVMALKKRKDLKVEIATLGRKAGKSKLAQLRAIRAPDELVEFYAEMDGIHVQWRLPDDSGIGCIRIPAVSQWTRFTGDDNHYMNFGDDREALLLDEITAEGNTWLVRSKESTDSEATIIFASAAEGSDGVVAASSIAEYLRKAMENGFGAYWPRCFRPLRNVSYADQERTIERFKAGSGAGPGSPVLGSRAFASTPRPWSGSASTSTRSRPSATLAAAPCPAPTRPSRSACARALRASPCTRARISGTSPRATWSRFTSG